MSAPMADGWAPTHQVAGASLPTWAVPDANLPSDNVLAAGLEVELVASQGGWAQVRCSNGWSAWVDAARLQPIPAGGGPVATGWAAQLENGWVAGAAALVAGVVVSYLLWPILAIPGKILKDAIPRGNCTNELPGSGAMYVCSVKAGLLTALGPFLTVVVAVVFRKPLAAQVAKLTAKLPPASRVLVAPVLATAAFTMVHASVHDQTADLSGLVPQRMFPALVGLFTLGASRLGPAVARRYGGSIAARDRFPLALRLLGALAVPLLASYVLTNQDRVSDTALKEQVVALLTLFTSYAALVPADGDFLGAAQRALGRRRTR